MHTPEAKVKKKGAKQPEQDVKSRHVRRKASGRALLRFVGSIPAEDLKRMEKAIEECETVSAEPDIKLT